MQETRVFAGAIWWGALGIRPGAQPRNFYRRLSLGRAPAVSPKLSAESAAKPASGGEKEEGGAQFLYAEGKQGVGGTEPARSNL